MSPQTWLITGASSGFGLEVALAALQKGHKVIGSVRSKTRSADAVRKLESAGAKTVELDMAQGASSIQAAAKQAESVYGSVDVLVNNAGYAVLGAIEDFGEKEVHAQFATNFFGPISLIQALLPGMRARKEGTIVNVSSIAGVDGLPSSGLYAASKFALEGMSESLARELAPWNINVLIVEPGAFRTRFLGAYALAEKGLSADYKDGPVDAVLKKFEEMNGKQSGDPVKGAKAIVDVVGQGCQAGGEKVRRLPLGADCLARMEDKVASLKKDMSLCKEVAESVAVNE